MLATELQDLKAEMASLLEATSEHQASSFHREREQRVETAEALPNQPPGFLEALAVLCSRGSLYSTDNSWSMMCCTRAAGGQQKGVEGSATSPSQQQQQRTSTRRNASSAASGSKGERATVWSPPASRS